MTRLTLGAQSFGRAFARLAHRTHVGIFLVSISAALTLLFAGPSLAVEKDVFTYGSGTVCHDDTCNPLFHPAFTVPGPDQYEAVCGLIWADAYIFPGDSYDHADPDGHCYYLNNGQTVRPFGFWKNTTAHDPKNNGDCCGAVANPINPSVGNKFQIETDYSGNGPSALKLQRTYNAASLDISGPAGANWRLFYERTIRALLTNPLTPVAALRPDGKVLYFTNNGGAFTATADTADSLTRLTDGGGQTIGFKLVTSAAEETEIYDASGKLTSISDRSGLTQTLAYDSAGRLLSVTDPFGRQLTFSYNSNSRIATATVPGGAIYQYAYDTAGNPTSVTYPGGAIRQYHYNEQAHINPTPEPLTWTRATVTVCHTPSCSPAFNDTAYVSGNDALAACTLAASQAFWFTATSFGGARGGPLTGECYYNDSFNNTQPTLGTWSVVSGCVQGTYPNQTLSGGNPGCPVDLPNALTGITDENGSRFATYTYDHVGQAVATEHAGGAGQAAVAYAAASSNVTDALGTVRTIGYQKFFGAVKPTSTAKPAESGTGNATEERSYDANGNLASLTDFVGNRTNYTYDLARNLQTSRTEGLTSAGGVTPQTRTIATEWDANFRLPQRIAEPLRITTNVYDPDGTQCGARGALCSRSGQATTDANGSQGFSATATGAPQIWTYTYNANGSVLTVNGPRTDVADITTYTYYANDDADLGKRGNVASIANAAGHTTNITAYNAHGQPLTIVDPNGLTTANTYDERQRLKTRTVGSELTTYDYDDAGQLTKVTLPDGSFLSYSYDAAHRLTGMQDNGGNHIAYTLDAMGNRTQEQVFDPASALVQTRSRVYSNLNHLFQELGALNQTTAYGYDDQGNVTSVKDPLDHVTQYQYDALNRLKQVTDPGTGVTQYAYNGRDALTQVTDPRSLVTGYTVDGLGNPTQQSSPDTGSTVNTYNAAGNLLTQTDAKGQLTTYAYDALNRVTLITFHDGSKQAYTYDQGTNGVGRLSSITETNPSNQQTSLIQYAYTPHGRVSSETRTVGGVQYALGYAYDTAGRLSGLTYPSGRTLTYSFDSVGRVSGISTTFNGQTQAVVSGVAYHPFGGVKSYTLGNGQVYTRSYDQDGRIASYTLGAKSFSIGYDAASRIEFISEFGSPANTNNYAYDSVDRLLSAVTPGTSYSYTYDLVGNRRTKTVGAASETLDYGASSNRVATLTPGTGPARSFVFDPNGSTTNDGVNTYAYDVRGRMVQATSVIGATSYQVNALGQRIRKTNSQADRVFHYDTRGRLIAETDPAGALQRELIYLGDIPVGVVQ